MGDELQTALSRYSDIQDLFMKSLQTKQKYLMLKEKTYWGSGGISTLITKSANECKSICGKKHNCTGGVYNTNTNRCKLRKGESAIIDSSNRNNIAIVSDTTYYAQQLYTLNKELIRIVENMSVGKYTSIMEANATKVGITKVKLDKLYAQLLEDRQEIDSIVQDKPPSEYSFDEVKQSHNMKLAFIWGSVVIWAIVVKLAI